MTSETALKRYKKPPITEAVIELRFATPQERKIIEGVAERLMTNYVYSETELNLQFTFEIQEQNQQKSKIENEWNGLKLSSSDRADIVSLRTTGISTSRLAPYSGWEVFRERAMDNWLAWKKEAASTRLGRIGVRYINRIDIPNPAEMISLDDYLLVSPRLPTYDWLPMTGYTLQVTRPFGRDDCAITINAGIVPSPLLNNLSLLLDIDIYRDTDVPGRDDDLWAFIDRVRHYKNEIFELCITDKARELFDK